MENDAWTNGRHFADDIFWKIVGPDSNSGDIVSNGGINNKLPLVQLMAWWRTSDKSLPEAMIAKIVDAI